MPVFVVSFRIANEQSNLGTYAERWHSVNDAIQAQANGRHYWKETTSFFAVESSHDTSSSLAKAVDAASKLDKARDTLLVVNLSAKGYTPLGVNKDNDLDAIMALR